MKTRAFTLLEIMLAVAILTLVGAAIFRFTETTLTATRIAMQTGESTQAVAGFARLLQAQLDSLPSAGLGGVTGGSSKEGELPNDDVTLVCETPAALLSRRAPGPWRVQLALRAGGDAAKGGTLGMQRLGPAEDPTAVDINVPAGPVLITDVATRRKAGTEAGQWVPLLENVAGFEVNYFNARLNGWLPKWNDPTTPPDLLRVRLTFANNAGRPLEMVLRVPPRTRQQALALTLVNPVNGASNGGPPTGLPPGLPPGGLPPVPPPPPTGPPPTFPGNRR